MNYREKVVYLSIHTYPNVGKHFYGAWTCGNHYNETIQWAPDVATCRRLNDERKAEGFFANRLSEGDETSTFFDRESLVAEAIRTYKTVFPNAEILVEGSRGTVEPMPVLDWPNHEEEAAKINQMVEECEEIGWYDGDTDRYEEIEEEWQAIWDQYFTEPYEPGDEYRVSVRTYKDGKVVETIRDMTPEERAEYDAEMEVDRWTDGEIAEIEKNNP
ncbi:MAG: hypothetical protein ACYS7Y_04095 [Planctomycetota bacterium]|jgi:hypothetical protein